MKFPGLAAFMAAPLFAFAQPTRPLLIDLGRPEGAEFAAEVRKALALPLATIVDKPAPSPTGDPHDYVSYGRYWWPDPARPDGLPYVRHDGRHNRERVEAGDNDRFWKFAKTVSALALAWSRNHREEHARRAGDWLRAWFIAPATRMKPAFDYAQIRLGHDKNRGSPSGVLDARQLAWVADAVRMLEGSPAFTAEESRAFREWFEEYYRWLQTAQNARKEHAAENNHGTWFLVQAAGIALYLGRVDDARKLFEEDQVRLAAQFKPDGSQPAELVRQDALGYCRFNLEAQLTLARLARRAGVDLWNYTAPNGASLKRGLDYLRPYNADPAKWPGSQREKLPPGFLDELLALAAELEKS